jgi:hypothetical protein
MKNEMLKTNEADSLCIIAVDWAELAKGGIFVPNYWKAMSNMRIAGEIISTYMKSNSMNEKNVHCIGFSLGAHMCSILYKTYFSKYGVKLGRITGLDPAGPFYKSKPTSEKLFHTDADLVDIIHTSEKFGLAEKSGHMDFYPDFGPSNVTQCSDLNTRYDLYDNVIIYQEGDTTDEKEAISASNYADVVLTDQDVDEQGGLSNFSFDSLMSKIKAIFESVSNYFFKKPKRVFIKLHQFFGCSHLAAMRFFLNSINQCNFYSIYCPSVEAFLSNKYNNATLCKLNEKVRMGYYADRASQALKTSMGDFYLRTTENPPFCVDPVKSSSKLEKIKNIF